MTDLPIKADIKVDATQALNTVSEGCRCGFGMIWDCIFLKRLARSRAESANIETQAQIDNELIRNGLARMEKDGLKYTTSEAQAINYLQTEYAVKKVKNICACLEEAEKELNEEKINNAKGKIDEDFLDEWQNIAGKTNTEYAQKLWGRILKTEICQPNSISIRALSILRNMSKLEAEVFTRIIPYTVNGVILDNEYKILTANELQMLHDSGIFASSIPLVNNNPITKNNIALKGLNWGYFITFDKEKIADHNNFVVSGAILTPTAKTLLQIPDSQMINTELLITIYRLLKKENNFIQQISVHPMIDENSFNPSITICFHSE